MITDEIVIKHLTMPKPLAIDLAVELYKQWQGENLVKDILTYAGNGGVVIVRPNLFGLAMMIDWKGEPAWFVRMAVGRLSDLLQELRPRLPKICLCRQKDEELDLKIRAYPLERLMHLDRLSLKTKLRRKIT